MLLDIHFESHQQACTLKVPENAKVETGDYVIFRTNEGEEHAVAISDIYEGDEQTVTPEMTFLRRATSDDKKKIQKLKEDSKPAIPECAEIIAQHGLGMNLLKAIYSFDGARLAFVFTADGRVDFRDLVRAVASHFKRRIHLQQIGPRDRARSAGGFGRCGRELCCSKFLTKFDSVTMDMARVQELHQKHSSKLSGCCDRLMCCLGYEYEEYAKMRADLPEVGTRVTVKKKSADVIGLDVLNRKVKVRTEKNEYLVCEADEVKIAEPAGRKALKEKPSAAH